MSTPVPEAPPRLKIKLQLTCGADIAMGPGKADLLDAIERAGSISGAARLMGMSYRRAWMLVDVMNRCFDAPLVATTPGGPAAGSAKGGGARVTPRGHAMLAHYRALQVSAEALTVTHSWHALNEALRPVPLAHQQDGTAQILDAAAGEL